MALFVAAALLGLVGSSMRPAAFVVATALLLGIATITLTTGLTWLGACGVFYGSLAVAEGSYLAAVCLRHWPGCASGSLFDRVRARRS